MSIKASDWHQLSDSTFAIIICAQHKYHRVVWAGRHLQDHPVPNPCCGQGHLPADQAAPSLIQPEYQQIPQTQITENTRRISRFFQLFSLVLLRSQLQKDLSEITQTKLKSKRSPNQDLKLSQNSQSWAKNYTGLNKTLITELQNFSELFLSLFSPHWLNRALP